MLSDPNRCERRNIRWLLVAVGYALLSVRAAQAAPTLKVGTVSGQAGTTVDIPITFDPGKASIACIEFDLTLPRGLSPGPVSAGEILTSAGKSLGNRVNGNIWKFVIFGINQTAIGSGTLLNLRVTIDSAATGILHMPLNRVVYTSPDAKSTPGGKTTEVRVNVTASGARNHQ